MSKNLKNGGNLMNMSIIDVSKLIIAEAYSGGYFMGF